MEPLTKEQCQELKDQWIEALRSNKYKRGQEVLRSKDNKFCCLGVLCDVIDPDGWTDESSYYNFKGPKDDNTTRSYDYPHPVLLNMIGLPASLMMTLANRNDGKESACAPSRKDKGYSFKEQATYIEKHWIIK